MKKIWKRSVSSIKNTLKNFDDQEKRHVKKNNHLHIMHIESHSDNNQYTETATQ